MEIYYGTRETKINITHKIKGIVYIPHNNTELDKIYGDPLPNHPKSIFINNTEYLNINIYVDINNNKVYTYPPNLFPITFCIPEEKIINDKDSTNITKEKILSNLIPGDMSTYIYNTEKEYYEEYQKSYFALTTKKAGWDCMRHYEILANGCIPYFPLMNDCPSNTLSLFPKELIKESNILYEDYNLKGLNVNEYNKLRTKLLDYTRAHLTTLKMAEYILNKINVKPNKILFLSGNLYSDYLRCLTLHGFKQLMGDKCHDYPKVPHLYKNHTIEQQNMWGKGFSYEGLLDNNLHNDELDKTIKEDIENKNYDIIIYGSLHRGLPLYDICSQYYKPNEIIFLCGEDEHKCCMNEIIMNGHYLFMREFD